MYRIGPISRKSNFHSREKCLIGLVLATLCLFCFGGIFLLPDNFGSDRVLRVYKQFQKAGPEIFIPAPPLAAHAPKDADPHFMGDRKKLQAKIKEELGELLDKPVIEEQQDEFDDSHDGGNGAAIVAAGEAGGGLDSPFDVEQQQQGAAPPLNGDVPPPPAHARNDDVVSNLDKNNLPVGNLNLQLPLGGNADSDPSVEEKRLKVKEDIEPCKNFDETLIDPIARKYFIQGHNGIRNKVALDFGIANMNLLYWSKELEIMASLYLRTCVIGPTTCNTIGKELLKCSMNYAFKKRHHLGGSSWPGKVVRSWYVEIGFKNKNWDEFLHGYNKDPRSLANFTQMIWPLAEFMGCGGASMYHGFFVVCFYWPEINPELLSGEKSIAVRGNPCTQCHKDRTACSRTFPSLCGVDNELSNSVANVQIFWAYSVFFTMSCILK